MSYAGYQNQPYAPGVPAQYIQQSYQPYPYNYYQQPTQQQPQQQPKSPQRDHTPPDLTLSVTQNVASQAVKRLVSSELRLAGFQGAQPVALERIEHELVAFVQKLYDRAKEYANLANRAGPIATDLLLACEDYHILPADLRKMSGSKKRKRAGKMKASALVAPSPPSPLPEMLDSDDETNPGPPLIPQTLRGLPPHFPPLPPKHTYLRTPVSPPKKAAVPSLDKKLKTASLVRQSLKNLLLGTEETTGQEDGELLGYIVNWETAIHPRKRWKVGGAS